MSLSSHSERINIHASAVLFHDDAVLFMGPTGAGKSTTAHHADGDIFRYWIEDTTSVYIHDGVLYAERLDKHPPLECHPVLAGFVLEKSDAVRIEPLPRLIQRIYFSRAVFELPANCNKPGPEHAAMFRLAMEMAGRLPVYRLHLTNDTRFVPELADAVENLLREKSAMKTLPSTSE